VPQLLAPGEVVERTLLPSFLYLPASGELSEAHRSLPWGASDYVVGELARRLGAKLPNRLVSSAKSWVCHGAVNRRAAILPWSAPDTEPHISPFEAQVAYLAHLRAAWEFAHPDAPLAAQDVVVTVPASFDEGARELTTQAAEAAGLGQVRLLEEPQAAFYEYLGLHAEARPAELADARLILVIDVGGGTTDFTLLRTLPDPADPWIERIAVGGHLMLGGDNMDAALASYALDKAGLERPRDPSIWSAYVQSACHAKERLLGPNPPASVGLTLTRRGSSLIAGSQSIPIERDEALGILLDGFLPKTGPAEVGERAARTGLTTLGLPYTRDVAIGRHIVSFLRRHATAAREAGARIEDGLPRPDAVLLNGGIFKATALIERLSEMLAGWYGDPVPLLTHGSLDTAVASGAVRSALARHGLGKVIGGGTARAYCIGIQAPDQRPAALCVAPREMQDGTTLALRDRIFDLVLDQPVAFPLYAYTGDRVDPPGTLVDLADADLAPLPPLQTVLRDSRPEREARHGGTLPVTLEATLSDTGALQVYLVSVTLPPRRWRLEFALDSALDGPAKDALSRGAGSDSAEVVSDQPAPDTQRARALLERHLRSGDPGRAKAARRALEDLLGPRGQWSAATCRSLWDTCIELEEARARSGEHELAWLRLCGWCLRPGLGMPGDEARLDRLWRLREQGLRHPSRSTWAEYWILWRRIAPGLDDARQQALYHDLRPWLWRESKPPPGPTAHGPVEMMQLLAALERLPIQAKTAAGELFISRSKKLGSYWALGRVGARALLRADDRVVVPPEIAQGWLLHLLTLDWAKADGAAFAAASIARVTGDPTRDVTRELRREVQDRLAKLKAPPSWLDLVMRPSDIASPDLARLLGDRLPAGLRLRG